MRTAIVVLIAVAIAGCTSAGPYVTSVVPLEGGALRVRRCMVEHRWSVIGDSIVEGACSEQTIQPRERGK